MSNSSSPYAHPTRGVSNVGTDGGFFSLCAAVCASVGEAATQSDAPLKGRLRLCSEIRPSFHANEYKAYFDVPSEGQPGLPVVRLSFLTLAGADGVLPWWITEKMMWDRHGDGQALHAFLDILNRRFWELLFIARCVGSNPHYGLYKRQHMALLGNLSYAAVGMGRDIENSHVNGANFVNRMQRYCWSAAIGTGGAEALGQLLTDSVGAGVTLQEHVPVHLEVTDQARLRLGPKQKGLLSSQGNVVGSKAWVACALAMSVRPVNSETLESYLPTKTGKSLMRLKQMLETCYVQNMPPLTVQLQCTLDQDTSVLGQRQLRLGWGAALFAGRDMSQILRISQHAVSCQKQ